jgi:NAD(P)H dehydrogenase (quinone)
MKVLVIVGHQNRQENSFCHAIYRTTIETLRADGHEVIGHDLYAEGFDCVLPQQEVGRGTVAGPLVQQHCNEVLAARGYVVIHPNWWAQPPAILKGWVDRVFRQGVIYEFGEKGAIIGHLAGRTAVVFTTSNTPREVELSVYGDPLENLWRTCVFGFCGVTDFQRCNFESIVMSTPDQRQQWLEEVRRMVRERFPATAEPPNSDVASGR